MIYRIIFFLLSLVLSPGDGQGDEKVYYREDNVRGRVTVRAERPKLQPVHNAFAIHELNKKKLSYGTYQISGYVIKKYICPPCPRPGACQPCMKPYIIVSEEFRVADENPKLSDEDMMIFVDDAAVFELGEKYKLLIHILDLKTSDQSVNDPKLIYYEKTEVPIYSATQN